MNGSLYFYRLYALPVSLFLSSYPLTFLSILSSRLLLSLRLLPFTGYFLFLATLLFFSSSLFFTISLFFLTILLSPFTVDVLGIGRAIKLRLFYWPMKRQARSGAVHLG